MRSVLFAFACALLAIACSPRFDWREIKSAEGGFALLMPEKPQTVTRDVAFDGRTISMTMVSTGVGPTLFAAGVARVPAEAVAPAQLDATLAKFRDALVRNIDGQTTRVEPIALPAAAAAGHAARGGEAFAARGHVGTDRRAGELAARLYVVDDRVYEVVAMGAEGELTADALDMFFSSFRLTQ